MSYYVPMVIQSNITFANWGHAVELDISIRKNILGIDQNIDYRTIECYN